MNDSYSIIMDNASIHKNLNLTSNVNIIYTPPYGCEYQPIELCFSQVKRVFRNKFVLKDVNEAIIQSVKELEPKTIQNCYAHVFEKIIPKACTALYS